MKAPAPIYDEEWDHIHQEDIPKVGEALFGKRWITAMMRALRVDRRTIEGWMDGRLRGIPFDKAADLRVMLYVKIMELQIAYDLIHEEEHTHKKLFGPDAKPVKSIRKKKPWVEAPIDHLREIRGASTFKPGSLPPPALRRGNGRSR